MLSCVQRLPIWNIQWNSVCWSEMEENQIGISCEMILNKFIVFCTWIRIHLEITGDCNEHVMPSDHLMYLCVWVNYHVHRTTRRPAYTVWNQINICWTNGYVCIEPLDENTLIERVKCYNVLSDLIYMLTDW